MEKLRIGIIGADFTLRSQMVLFNFPFERAELVALCDRDQSMLDKFKTEHPEHSPKFYNSAYDLFADKNVEIPFPQVVVHNAD